MLPLFVCILPSHVVDSEVLRAGLPVDSSVLLADRDFGLILGDFLLC